MIEPKDIVAVVGGVIASSVVVFNWRANRFRSKIREDLAILKQYREELAAQGTPLESILSNEHYIALQTSIERKIVRAYIYKGTDFSDLAISAACVGLSAFIWLKYPVDQPKLKFILLTSFAALATAFFFKSIHDRKEPHST